MHPNPFGSWAEQHDYPTWGTEPTPSVFGALPYTGITVSNLVTFTFTGSAPSLFNSVVIGTHDNQVHYRVQTDDDVEGYSTISNASGSKIALIEWRGPPLVEIRNILPKQKSGQWLKLTTNKSAREMHVRGIQYFWAPQNNSIELTTQPSVGGTFLARITRGRKSVRLEMTPDALQLGLLDAAVVATLLLQCGWNID